MVTIKDHMQLLRQQTLFKKEHPNDNSFTPISLILACLLRQLPPSLALPPGLISFQMLDQVSLEDLLLKCQNIAMENPQNVLIMLEAMMKYIILVRSLLAICHAHLCDQLSTEMALESIIASVLGTSNVSKKVQSNPRSSIKRTTKAQKNENVIKPTIHQQKSKEHKVLKQLHTPRVPELAPDPSGIIKRALNRDSGDGKTVIELMHRYPRDERLQAHGIRALKILVYSSHSISTPKDLAPAIQQVLISMNKYPTVHTIQRDGIYCISKYISQSDQHIPVLTKNGGITIIMNVMRVLHSDNEVQIAGLSIFGHPKITDDNVLRVKPESRQLVLEAMKRFPLDEKIQGLCCLALTNLSLRDDESMHDILKNGGISLIVKALNKFQKVEQIQAAGCWFIGTICSKNREMIPICQDYGCISAVENSQLQFPHDEKVLEYTNFAMQYLLIDNDNMDSISKRCSIQ